MKCISLSCEGGGDVPVTLIIVMNWTALSIDKKLIHLIFFPSFHSKMNIQLQRFHLENLVGELRQPKEKAATPISGLSTVIGRRR